MSYWTKRRKVEKTLRQMKNRCLRSKSKESFQTAQYRTAYSVESTYPCISSSSSSHTNFSKSDESDSNEYLFRDSGSEFSDTEKNKSSFNNKNLQITLQIWAVENRISITALGKLLIILQDYHPSLPKDARKLLSIPKSFDIINVAGGSYYHIGLKNCLQEQINIHSSLSLCSEIYLQLNIDGLPLFKSSQTQLWPILAKIEKTDKKDRTLKPFVIGLYLGNHKPKSAHEFLKFFVDEMKSLEKGFWYKGKSYFVKIRNIICDAQARFFIKQVKSCSGYSGCDKCTQSGIHTGLKMVFPETDSLLRTDSSFNEMVDEQHHKGENPFKGLCLGMISQFPLDYMHLVCLGVTKRLLLLWLSGPLKIRIGTKAKNVISECLVSLKSSIPLEFARKPRSLSEIPRWKATEFRQFLLYSGIVALRGKISTTLYNNFLLLSIAIRILCDQKLCLRSLDYAQFLLVTFVKQYSKLFGAEDVVYNVHALVHLPNDVRLYGSLDNFSAFPFESFLGQIKRYVRKPSSVLQQIISRLQENQNVDLLKSQTGLTSHSQMTFPILKNEHYSGPLPASFDDYKQYSKIVSDQFTLTTALPNNCFTSDSEICLVSNILHKGKDVLILYRKFLNVKPFFDYPCKSSDFAIYKVNSLSELSVCNFLNVECKSVLLPFCGNSYVSMPLIHT